MKKGWIIALVIVATILTTWLATRYKETSVEIAEVPLPQLKLGVALPLSGDGAVFGEKAQKGIEVALSGIPMGAVSVVYEDTQGLGSAGAVSAVSKLLSVHGSGVLLGPLGPEATLATAPLSEKVSAPHFAYSLCSTDFVKYQHLFCIYPSISEQLATLPRFLQSEQIHTVAGIFEQTAYGDESRLALEKGAAQGGYLLTLDERVQPDTNDFKAIAAKLAALKPDAVFVAMADVSKTFLAMKQLSESGYPGMRIAYVDTDPSYLEDFGTYVEGVYVPGALSNNFASGFTQAFTDQFNEEPDLYAAIAYDAFRYLYGSWVANQRSTIGISEAVVNYQYLDSAIPRYQFSSERTISFPTEIWVVKNGKYEKVKEGHQ